MKYPAGNTFRNPGDGRQQFVSNRDFRFEQGGVINPLVLAYETWGRLDAARSNAVLVHHALSTGSHVAASSQDPEPGWWQEMVGPGRPIDTDRYFVICINNLGSCHGSSGPASIDPATSEPYGPQFPAVTIVDMVRSQRLLIDHLGIRKLHAIIGSSMGAMLSMTWLALYPDHARRMVSISSCARSYPANAANRMLQREAIVADPGWNDGHYRRDRQLDGFTLARKIGLLTYRNQVELNQRFMDKTGDEAIGNYLDYNAKKFTRHFDCNSYLSLIGAMDAFDLRIGGRDLVDVFREIKTPVLVISVDSDVLFPPFQQQELFRLLSDAGVETSFIAHHSDYGHDAFLVETDAFGRYIRDFIDDSPVSLAMAPAFPFFAAKYPVEPGRRQRQRPEQSRYPETHRPAAN